MDVQQPSDFDFSAIGAEPLEPGDPRVIGAFPIKAVLGAGGMGRVYLGLAPEGYAAVKTVLPHLANDRHFLRHFGSELKSQVKLPDGVSTRMLAADLTARPPWFATEYVPGVTLHDAVYLNGCSLPPATVWVLLRELAARLKAVAALNIVHRDLKPSNVMLTRDGLTLIDFGLARAVDQSSATMTGAAVGTPSYMAPEQALAENDTLTPAVDVFSLGSMLTFAATGLPPFGEGSGAGMFYRIVHRDPDLEALRAVDPALADVVESCLAKEPADRPTAAELAETAAGHAAPGIPQWPGIVSARIDARRMFAAGAPVHDPEITEFDELAEVNAPVRTEGTDVALDAAEPRPIQVLEVPPGADDPAAHAETEVLNPTGGPSKHDERPRRGRKALALLVPLLVFGTAGTLVAMNDVPWTTDPHTSTAGNVIGGSATGTPTTSPRHTGTPAPTAKPTKPASPSPGKSSTGQGSTTGGGGNVGSTGANGGSVGSTGSSGSTGSDGSTGSSGSSGSTGSTGSSGTTGGSGGSGVSGSVPPPGGSDPAVVSASSSVYEKNPLSNACMTWGGGGLATCQVDPGDQGWKAEYISSTVFVLVGNGVCPEDQRGTGSGGTGVWMNACSSSAGASTFEQWYVAGNTSGGGIIENVADPGDCMSAVPNPTDEYADSLTIAPCNTSNSTELWVDGGTA